MRYEFSDPKVAILFDSYPTEIKEKLFELRELIFDTATTLDETGGLIETLKWQQASYLTKSKSGSTIRINQEKSADNTIALYFHCQTTLIESFRQLLSDTLTFSGNRAILLKVDEALPEKELRHCIEMALTYHLHKP